MDNYIFYITTIQSSSIKTLFEVLKDVLSDANIVLNPSGIHITALDPTKLSLIDLNLEGNKFETYYCPNKKIIGVSMNSIYKLIKSTSNKDNISFIMHKNNNTQIIIRIENAEKKSRTEYNLNLLDLDEENLSIPETEFDYIINLPSGDFQRLSRDMQNLSDYINIKLENDILNISCKGDFASQNTSIGETSHGLIFHKKSDTIYNHTFSLKYINLFTKTTNLSNIIEISLKNDYPLCIKYSVANLGQIRFCLAPTSDN